MKEISNALASEEAMWRDHLRDEGAAERAETRTERVIRTIGEHVTKWKTEEAECITRDNLMICRGAIKALRDVMIAVTTLEKPKGAANE